MIIIKILIQTSLFIFPWKIRRSLLQLFFNFKISGGARIGRSLILASKVIIEEGAIISNFNFVNNIDKIHLKAYSKIGRKNWITGPNTKSTKAFSAVEGRKCELIVGKHSRITDRHIIDCTGGVYVGSFSTIAGNRSQILTHSIDIKSSTQKCKPINIGDYSFIGTSCILLMGASVPSYSVLGAGSVMTKSLEEEYALYGGNPAKFIKKLEIDNLYFHRKTGNVS